MFKRKGLLAALILGVIIGLGAMKFVYEQGLLSPLDFSEYVDGLNQGKLSRVYDFKKRAHMSNQEDWEEIVNTRKFQKLSPTEQTILRNKYYSVAIKPTLTKYGTEDAEIEFRKYAGEIEAYANKYGFFEEPLLTPRSGEATKHMSVDYVAPLEIRTRDDGYNYFIKVSNWETNKPVLSLFIRSGDTAKVEVPVGAYSIKYATGKVWYGEEFLFGPGTSRSKAEKKFVFESTSEGISG